MHERKPRDTGGITEEDVPTKDLTFLCLQIRDYIRTQCRMQVLYQRPHPHGVVCTRCMTPIGEISPQVRPFVPRRDNTPVRLACPSETLLRLRLKGPSGPSLGRLEQPRVRRRVRRKAFEHVLTSSQVPVRDEEPCKGSSNKGQDSRELERGDKSSGI